MYRFVENELKSWSRDKKPIPLILRGARQIGKTFIVEKSGKKFFTNFLKINFEKESSYKKIFEKDLDVKEILRIISLNKHSNIIPGKTLVFFDEIQECPRAIQSLRYFYEDVPGLHIIAAGSLLEFKLRSDEFKMPVGRVESIYMQAMTFYEFLIACGREDLQQYLETINLKNPPDDLTHDTLMKELKKYMAIGGMPKAVEYYVKYKDDLIKGFLEAKRIHDTIIETYRYDFGKYAKEAQHGYLEDIFNYVPKSVGNKFKYSHVSENARTEPIKNAWELLEKAGLVYKIKRSNAQIPLEVGSSDQHFKALFLDVGLMQSVYGMDINDILTGDPFNKIVGGISEQFIGQELLALENPHKAKKIYYWERESNQSSAEVDYITNVNGKPIAIEVKSGKTGRLKSLHLLMDKFKLPMAIRFSQKNLYYENSILSIPLYAVAEYKRLIKEV